MFFTAEDAETARSAAHGLQAVPQIPDVEKRR